MADIVKADKANLEAYKEKLHRQQVQKFPSKYNLVKLSYQDDQPELLGKFVKIKSGETDFVDLGESFKGIILAKRHQYSWFSKTDKEKFMRTAQFSEWNEPVNVVFEGLKDTVKGISQWIKSKYAKESPKEATYKTILYILIDGEVYLMRVGGTSCASWFKYVDAMDPRSLLFSNVTEFGRDKMRNPMGKTYYPITFKLGEPTDPKEFDNLLVKSFEVDQMIAGLENGTNPNATDEEIEASITPDDLPFKDTKAEAEELEKKKFLEAVK